MTTDDEPLTQNYDSDKQKSEIDGDIGVLKIRQRLAAHSGRRNCILQSDKQESKIDSDIGVLDSDLQRIRAEEIVFYN